MNDYHDVGGPLELRALRDLAAILVPRPSGARIVLVADVGTLHAVGVPPRDLNPGVARHLLDEQPVALLV
eukprot:4191379-Heterocapsa_arctica.AAC.1